MRRGWQIAGGIATGLAFVALGVFLFKAGLDDADKWSSVIGAFVGLAGLILSGYGVVLSRRAMHRDPPRAGTQVTASGTRSIAAHTISGTVSTGDTAPPAATEENTRPTESAAPTGPADAKPAAETTPPTETAQLTVTASGERSIAAHTISGTASTGDETSADH